MSKFTSFLKETDLFYNLSATQLEMVDSICEERQYREGELIFSENSHEKELYLIFSGQVDIYINPSLVSRSPTASTHPEMIAHLLRGQSFGEVALVDEGVRSAGAKAGSRDTVLLADLQRTFAKLMQFISRIRLSGDVQSGAGSIPEN